MSRKNEFKFTRGLKFIIDRIKALGKLRGARSVGKIPEIVRQWNQIRRGSSCAEIGSSRLEILLRREEFAQQKRVMSKFSQLPGND